MDWNSTFNACSHVISMEPEESEWIDFFTINFIVYEQFAFLNVFNTAVLDFNKRRYVP